MGIVVVLKLELYYVFHSIHSGSGDHSSFLIFDTFRVKLIKLSSLDLKLGKDLIVFSIPLTFTG